MRHFIPALRLALALAIASGVTFAASPALAAPAVKTATGWKSDPELWGINDPALAWSLSNEELLPRVAAIKKLGARWVRYAVNWPRIQAGGRDTYRWTESDYMIGRLAMHGLRWRPVTLDVPAWLRIDPTVDTRQPPASAEAIAEFLDEFLDRYGPGGTMWRDYPWLPAQPVLDLELHNEPNHVFFWGFDTSTWTWRSDHGGAAWGKLYGEALDIVAAEHPDVRFWMGGLATPFPYNGGTPATTFIRNAFEAHPSLKTTLAGAALHTYPDATGNWYVASVHAALAIAALREHGGADMQVQLNEFGVSKVRVPSEAARSAFVGAIADLASSNCPIAGIAPYTLFSREQDPNNPEDWYGLVKSSGDLHAPGATYAGKVAAYNAGTAQAPALAYCS